MVLLLFGDSDYVFGPGQTTLQADVLGRLFDCEVLALRFEQVDRSTHTFFVLPIVG